MRFLNHTPSPAVWLCALLTLALFAVGCGGGNSGVRLLASEYGTEASTLVLIDPEDPNGQRDALAEIEHATGWDIAAAVAPSGSAAAVLALAPTLTEPRIQSALYIVAGRRVRPLAENLDIFGGLAWSPDGNWLAVRRDEGMSHTILVLNVDNGEPAAAYSVASQLAAHVVGFRDDQLLLAVHDSNGWQLRQLEIDRKRRTLTRTSEILLAPQTTREWTLSPDGSDIAFTVQNGYELWVELRSLDGAAVPPIVASHDWQTDDFAPVEAVDRRIRDAAGPAWRPDGRLAVGRWSGRAGFTLPIAWSPDGGWLAVRALDGEGPRNPGQSWSGLVRAGHELQRIDDPDLFVIGWWSE